MLRPFAMLTSLRTEAAAVAVVDVCLLQRLHGRLFGDDALVIGFFVHGRLCGCGGTWLGDVLFGFVLGAAWGCRRGCRLSVGISRSFLGLSCGGQ